MASHRYVPLRYARVGETGISGDRLLPVEWVMLSRWDFDTTETHFCVEYLDSSVQIAGEDTVFRTEQEAERHAIAEFHLAQPEWRDGVPRPA